MFSQVVLFFRCRNTEGSFICEAIYQCQPGYKKTQHDECVGKLVCGKKKVFQ